MWSISGIAVMVMDYSWLSSCQLSLKLKDQLWVLSQTSLLAEPLFFLGTPLPFDCQVDVQHPAWRESTNSLALPAITAVRRLIRATRLFSALLADLHRASFASWLLPCIPSANFLPAFWEIFCWLIEESWAVGALWILTQTGTSNISCLPKLWRQGSSGSSH